MAKHKRICDLCGEEFIGGKPVGVYSNVWVYMGEYSVKIGITKAGMFTELCKRCLAAIVTQALSQNDPHFGLILETDDAKTEARKRKERKSCPVSGT